jgi:hypothetical protein
MSLNLRTAGRTAAANASFARRLYADRPDPADPDPIRPAHRENYID